jgi:hypothetical protein
VGVGGVELSGTGASRDLSLQQPRIVVRIGKSVHGECYRVSEGCCVQESLGSPTENPTVMRVFMRQAFPFGNYTYPSLAAPSDRQIADGLSMAWCGNLELPAGIPRVFSMDRPHSASQGLYVITTASSQRRTRPGLPHPHSQSQVSKRIHLKLSYRSQDKSASFRYRIAIVRQTTSRSR